MTVASVEVKKIFQGNGATTVFPVYPIEVLQTEHLHCRVVADGVESEVSNFTVQGLGSGAVSVVYPASGAPLPAGRQLIIYRRLPVIQETDLVEYGVFSAETIERRFDYLTMVDQQQQEKIDRAILVDMSQGSPPTAQEFYAEIKQFSDAAAASANAGEASAQQAAASVDQAQDILAQVDGKGNYYVEQAAIQADRAENAASTLPGFAQNAHVFFGFTIDENFNLILTKSEEGDYLKVLDFDAWAIWPVQTRPYVQNSDLLLELPFQPPYE